MTKEFAIPVSDRARKLLADSYVVDCRDPTFLMYSFTKDPKGNYWDSIAASGLNAICVDPNWVDAGLRDTAADLADWYARIREHDCILVESVQDIKRARQEGKTGFIFAPQSPDAMEDNAGFIEILYKMGIRIMQFAYQRRNYLAEGVGEPTNCGLSTLGRKALKEMNRVGMLADLAHATEQTMWDILEYSEDPVINSHSCCRALCSHRRNVEDALIKAQAEKGGVFCLSAYSAFLKEGGGQSGTTMEDWARHMDHLLNLIGPDHVGIGFDVGEERNAAEVQILHAGTTNTGKGPKYRYVSELTCRANYPLVVEKLIELGLSDQDISKVIGGNLMNIFSRVWK